MRTKRRRLARVAPLSSTVQPAKPAVTRMHATGQLSYMK